MSKDSKAKKTKKHYKSLEKKTALWGLIFLLPWLIGLIFFFLRPLFLTFYYAFNSMEMESGVFKGTFNGIENFKYALGVDADFTKDLASAFTSMLTNGQFKGRGFFRAIFFIPIILATGITTIELSEVSLTAQTSESVVNLDWLTDLVVNSGIPQQITTLLTSYISNIFDVVTTSGVQILIFLSGLQAISPTLYEVAQLEGCSAFETFCKITLPMISPMILVCLVYSISEAFAKADVTDTIYNVTFKGQSMYYGYGAAMSVIYFVATLASIGIICGIVSKGVFYYD